MESCEFYICISPNQRKLCPASTPLSSQSRLSPSCLIVQSVLCFSYISCIHGHGIFIYIITCCSYSILFWCISSCLVVQRFNQLSDFHYSLINAGQSPKHHSILPALTPKDIKWCQDNLILVIIVGQLRPVKIKKSLSLFYLSFKIHSILLTYKSLIYVCDLAVCIVCKLYYPQM